MGNSERERAMRFTGGLANEENANEQEEGEDGNILPSATN